MAQRRVTIGDIGEVILQKRRGSRTIRLSVSGQAVRVSMPVWVPYKAGENFARQKADWIKTQLKRHPAATYQHGQEIGKRHQLQIHYRPEIKRATSRISDGTIHISTPFRDVLHEETQATASRAVLRALKQESELLILPRLTQLSKQHNLAYTNASVKRMRSRWGSCNSKGVIALNSYLVQLPWSLIDYVLLHELAHTRHLNHGPNFWALLEELCPNAKQLRKQLRTFHPELHSL